MICIAKQQSAASKIRRQNLNSLFIGIRHNLIALFFLLLAMNRAAAAMSNAAQTKKGALIFLHGLGDSPAGWSSLEQTLPSMRPRLQDIAYVFPPAPTIPISINGGMTMPGWFDLYDWPIDVGSQDDPKGLQRSVDSIKQAIQKLNADGIPSSKIVVGGFSQGGAVALLTCVQEKEDAFAGCAALSAWLTLPDQLDISEKAKVSPLFWGHGRMDDKVLFEQQAFGVKRLKEEGVKVTDKAYPMGHSSHPQEMEDLAAFVEQCLFSEEARGPSSEL